MASDRPGYYRIASLERGVHILDLLSRHGTMTLTAVAKALNEDRSVCHRALLTLRDLGLVHQPGGHGYGLTMHLFEMGMRVVNRLEARPLIRPYMEELCHWCNETINLGYKDGEQIVYLDSAKHLLLRAELSVGTRIPIHCSALGKAILAFRPSQEQAAFLANSGLTAHTRRTITSSKVLANELAMVRSQGFAVDDEEHYEGVRCVAVPLLDHTGHASYSISISGPSSRISLAHLMAMSQRLTEVGRKISDLLGSC